MYVLEGGFPTINSIGVVEGQFSCAPGDYSSVSIELLLVYLNHPTMTTFGTCPVKGELLSKNTHDKFREFLLSAEEDFGKIAKEPVNLETEKDKEKPTFPTKTKHQIRRVPLKGKL